MNTPEYQSTHHIHIPHGTDPDKIIARIQSEVIDQLADRAIEDDEPVGDDFGIYPDFNR